MTQSKVSASDRINVNMGLESASEMVQGGVGGGGGVGGVGVGLNGACELDLIEKNSQVLPSQWATIQVSCE